jgi:large subunit ribosomal protein L16
VQRGKIAGVASRNNKLDHGDFGLQVLGAGWITNSQIEAARVALTRHMKRRGQVWIRMFPDKPISKKPLETRMGKGKGNPETWVAVVKPGRVIFEASGCTEQIAREGFKRAAQKLSLPCRMLARHNS